MGLMNIQTGDRAQGLDVESTNFSAFRVKRDLFARSNIGVIATHRNISADGPGSNSLYGVDGNFAPTDNIRVNTFYMATSEAGVEAGHQAASYMGQFRYDTDLIDVSAERLYLGEDFNPGMGFVRRRDFTKNGGSFTFAPRPARHRDGSASSSSRWTRTSTTVPDGELETREYNFEGRAIFESSDRLRGDPFGYRGAPPRRLPTSRARSACRPAATVSPAADSASGWERTAPSRDTSATSSATSSEAPGGRSSYWGRAEVNRRFSMEPNISLNWIDVSRRAKCRRGSAASAPPTPSLRSSFVGALVQYNSAAQLFSANVRFRWEYSPGSDLFVVFSTNRDGDDGLSGLTDRALVVKFTRLFRF